MYFPILNTMRKFQVDEFLIKKLDVWLGTRRKAVRKFLSPLQFSLDTNIDEDVSMDLFLYCTEKDLKILKQRFVVTCPVCDRILGVYTLPTDIPEEIFCAECNHTIKITEDMITIWFELLVTPQHLPKDSDTKSVVVRNDGLGKNSGLRVEQLKNSKTEAARRLLSSLNERFRNS
jgi:hypothetical protein